MSLLKSGPSWSTSFPKTCHWPWCIGINPGVMWWEKKFKRKIASLDVGVHINWSSHNQTPTGISEWIYFQKPVYFMKTLWNATLLSYFLVFHHKHKEAFFPLSFCREVFPGFCNFSHFFQCVVSGDQVIKKTFKEIGSKSPSPKYQSTAMQIQRRGRRSKVGTETVGRWLEATKTPGSAGENYYRELN